MGGNAYSAIGPDFIELLKTLASGTSKVYHGNVRMPPTTPETLAAAATPPQQVVQAALAAPKRTTDVDLPSHNPPLGNKPAVQNNDLQTLFGGGMQPFNDSQMDAAKAALEPVGLPARSTTTGYDLTPLTPAAQHASPDFLSGAADDSDSGGLGGLLGKMDAQDWLGAAGLGLGATGMFMNAANQKDQFNKQFGEEQRQFNVGATQLNPYKQQGDAAKLAMMRALAESGPAQAQLGSAQSLDPARAGVGAAANQYLSDEALTKSKADFDQKMALQNALQQQPAKKSGGGFWKTLGKIGAIAAPIVAAPFTGGASLALIGAGAGAASSALNGGGLKGALLGAGLGAIPGIGTAKGAASGAMPTLTAGLKQAGKSLVTKPQNALALMNALH